MQRQLRKLSELYIFQERKQRQVMLSGLIPGYRCESYMRLFKWKIAFNLQRTLIGKQQGQKKIKK